MKRVVFYIFNNYHKYFPIDRGKQFIAKMLTRMFSSFEVKTKFGYSINVFVSSSQDLHLANITDYKKDSIGVLIDQLNQGDVFFDIGANIGFYSFLASQKVTEMGRVYSIEPSFREYTRLINGIVKNRCSNIVPFNLALSQENREHVFVISSFHTGLNKLQNSINQTEAKILCSTFKLDTLVNSLGIQYINLLKLDVEGAEYMVLQGMQETLHAKKIGKLVVEITDRFLLEFGSSKSRLYEFMTSLGYMPLVNSGDWQYDEVFIPNTGC